MGINSKIKQLLMQNNTACYQFVLLNVPCTVRSFSTVVKIVIEEAVSSHVFAHSCVLLMRYWKEV